MPCKHRAHAFAWRALLPLLLAATSAGAAPAPLPKGTNVSSLLVITDSALANSAQKVMIATLQGLVARQSPNQLYIDSGGSYNTWYHHLNTAYGIGVASASNPYTLLRQYKNYFNGYILYDAAANSNSLNAATSLCGPLHGIAVDASIESQVRSSGGVTNLLLDVRGKDEGWVWTNYNARFSRTTVVEQKETFSDFLRDYAVMADAFIFYDGNSPFRSFVMSQMNPDSAGFGWGDASKGEEVFVGQSSSKGVFTVPSDWAMNLSTLSSIRDPFINQRTYASLVPEEKVHYVTFIVTDGDNVQWDLGGFTSYFNVPARGRFHMGWALAPALADLAPSVLRWYFEAASNGPNQDIFVAGPSGAGYFYPSMYPSPSLDLQVQRLNDLMARADMDLVQILDFNAFNRPDLWNRYLAQPNINGLFYLEYAPYNGAHGAVLLATNGEPVIAARDLLWSGLEEEANLIANLKSYPRDPASPSGYTFVSVHVWSKTLANVLQVVTNLPPDVRVVTPDIFARLVRNNVGRKLAYDFTTSLQGWAGGTSGKFYDKAQWTASAGNGPGGLVLDGSDLGQPDSQPNAWFSRQISLPPNATALSFQTRADAGTTNGLLRVRLQRPDGTFVVLLDWEQLKTSAWVTRTASLAAYAGQTVTLYFEQNDGGLGAGEFRYLDNVTITTAGAPLYPPAAPRLLNVTAGNSVTLSWRDNDANETGFKVERSLESGPWVEIAAVASNVTGYVDGAVMPGTNYLYRLRAFNSQGLSPYSNIGSVVVPPRPAITAALSGAMLQLTWPSWASGFRLYEASGLPASSWSPVTNVVSISGNVYSVELPPTTGSHFFQLRKP